jgi:hypothetical protein
MTTPTNHYWTVKAEHGEMECEYTAEHEPNAHCAERNHSAPDHGAHVAEFYRHHWSLYFYDGLYNVSQRIATAYIAALKACGGVVQ